MSRGGEVTSLRSTAASTSGSRPSPIEARLVRGGFLGLDTDLLAGADFKVGFLAGTFCCRFGVITDFVLGSCFGLCLDFFFFGRSLSTKRRLDTGGASGSDRGGGGGAEKLVVVLPLLRFVQMVFRPWRGCNGENGQRRSQCSQFGNNVLPYKGRKRTTLQVRPIVKLKDIDASNCLWLFTSRPPGGTFLQAVEWTLDMSGW